MSAEEGKSRPLGWADVASPHWYPEGQLGTLWISAFLVMLADRTQIAPEPVVVDFEDARALAFYGQMPYLRLANDEIRSTETPEYHINAPEEVTSPEGAYLLLILPFDDDNPSDSESRNRARVAELGGLLVALFGPNVAYRRLFDNVVRPQSNQRTVFGDSFRNPGSMPAPNLNTERIRLAAQADLAMKRLPTKHANRVSLSLRWYFDAQHSSGVDLFLKLWFAIESLGMSRSDNIRPVVEALARSYGIASRDARHAFHVGRLFGFRSKIVHQGHIPPIHALLSDYVAALCLDALYDLLSLPHEGFAARVQESSGFDIAALAP